MNVEGNIAIRVAFLECVANAVVRYKLLLRSYLLAVIRVVRHLDFGNQWSSPLSVEHTDGGRPRAVASGGRRPGAGRGRGGSTSRRGHCRQVAGGGEDTA